MCLCYLRGYVCLCDLSSTYLIKPRRITHSIILGRNSGMLKKKKSRKDSNATHKPAFFSLFLLSIQNIRLDTQPHFLVALRSVCEMPSVTDSRPHLLVFGICPFILTKAGNSASYKWMCSKGNRSYNRSFNYFFVRTVHIDSKLGKEYCRRFYFNRSVTEEKSISCSCSVLLRVPHF